MFDITKRYRTRDGKEVRLYADDGRQPHPLHGAYLSERGWIVCAWTLEGMYWQEGRTSPIQSEMDIIIEPCEAYPESGPLLAFYERHPKDAYQLFLALDQAMWRCKDTEQFNAMAKCRQRLWHIVEACKA